MYTRLCVYQVFSVAFIGHYLSSMCNPVHSCAFPGVLVSEDILDGVVEAIILRGRASASLGHLRQTKI